MTPTTADLYDEHEGKVQVLSVLLQTYGKKPCFSGAVATVKCHEDNTQVKAALETPGLGRVLVVDGGASIRCALMGDKLARMAVQHGWQGIIVNGCIRDSVLVNTIDIGIKALGTNPKKSVKKGAGDKDIPVRFGDVVFTPGAWLYADADGVLLCNERLC